MEFRKSTKEIDGIKFTVNEFPAFEAFKLHRKLLKILAPSIGQLVEGLNLTEDLTVIDGAKSLLESKISGDSFTKALNSLLDELDETSYIKLVKELVKYTCAYTNMVNDDGESVRVKMVSLNADNFTEIFNVIFHGKPFTIYKLIAFVLEVNFPDFFNRANDSDSEE